VVAEHGVSVGEQLPGHASEVIETAHQALEAHLARAAGSDPDRRHPAVPEDRHHGVQFGQLLAERPAPDVLPVRLGLHSGQGLEAHLGLMRRHRAQWTHLAQEGPIAAQVRVLGAQLVVQVGAAEHRTHQQPAFDVGQLRLAERVPRGALRVPRRALCIELPAYRAPVQLEVAGERADAPSVLVQDMQFHPEFLRLHGGPSWCWWL
jgi:hypothetical protein